MGGWNNPTDLWELFTIRSPENQSTWRPGYLRLNSLLQKYTSEGALWTYRMEVFQTFSSATTYEIWRPTPSYKISLWWLPGRPSCSLMSSLLITRHLLQWLTLVVYQWQVGTFEYSKTPHQRPPRGRPPRLNGHFFWHRFIFFVNFM